MALVDRTAAAGVLPMKYSSEIIKEVPKQSSVLQAFRQLPNMTSKEQEQPILSSMISAGFVNGDTGLKPTDVASWDKKKIVAEELAVIVPIAEAVYDDADVDLFAQIQEQAMQAFGAAIDAAVLFGTNKPTSWPTALVPFIKARNMTVTAGTNTDIAGDVSAAMSLVEGQGFAPNAHLSDIAIRGQFRNLRDLNNNVIYSTSIARGMPDTLWNLPNYVSDNGAWDSTAATGARVITGDFTKAVYAIRQDITYKILDQAVITDDAGKVLYNFSQNDMIGIRMVMRLGWQIANPITALAPTYDPSTGGASPFAAVIASA